MVSISRVASYVQVGIFCVFHHPAKPWNHGINLYKRSNIETLFWIKSPTKRPALSFNTTDPSLRFCGVCCSGRSFTTLGLGFSWRWLGYLFFVCVLVRYQTHGDFQVFNIEGKDELPVSLRKNFRGRGRTAIVVTPVSFVEPCSFLVLMLRHKWDKSGTSKWFH